MNKYLTTKYFFMYSFYWRKNHLKYETVPRNSMEESITEM